MSWQAVQTWRDSLRSIHPEVPHLSPENARFCLDAALASWEAVPTTPDRPAPGHSVMVCASTVFTAPLEWCAVLLGRGGRLTLKIPRAHEPWFEQLVSTAAAAGLPLHATRDRGIVRDADRVIAMGSNSTIDAIRSLLHDESVLIGFGHRYSVAWWTDPSNADAVALDLAMYDGRGCMSPVAVYSPLPDAGPLLSAALARVASRLPIGEIAPIEGARIRERLALTKVLGRVHGAVCELPMAPPPLGLPRTPVLHRCERASFEQTLRSAQTHLSCIGTDDAPFELALRHAALGEMQRPPMDRLHDGVDWLREV